MCLIKNKTIKTMTDKQIKKSPFQILFVDDEEKTRKYFAKGLGVDFNVLTAGNVEEAQKIIEENHQTIAVVVSDQRMPGGNGVILLEFLRSKYPDIIRILTTAYSDLTDAIESVNKGEIFRYIQKPWDFELLKTEMAQALELFELRAEYNKMLYEKMAIRQKMHRMERARYLILIGRTINFIRFSDLAIADFIKQLGPINIEEDNSENWQELEMGGEESLEMVRSLNILDKIYNKISVIKNYNFDSKISGEEIKSTLQKIADQNGLNTNITGSASALVNLPSFNLFLSELILACKNMGGKDFEINLNQDNDMVLITFNLGQAIFPVGSNIFSAQAKSLKLDLHINLLSCYLTCYHHGGQIISKYDNQTFSLIASIPCNPSNVILNPVSIEELIEDITVLFT